MPPLTNEQINELAIAQNRVSSGTPGAPTDTNAGDVANLDNAAGIIGQSNVDNIQNIANIGTGSPLASAPDIVSDGTDELHDELADDKKAASDAVAGAESQSESLTQILDRLTNEKDDLDNITSEQQDQIDEAGRLAGLAFEPLVQDAEFARKQTLPQDIVRAGQRGGFESTQMAGAAALQRTTPGKGEAFVGAGGILDEQRQSLDRNLSLVKAKREEAIAAAKSAERKFIRDGKREDYQMTIDLVKLANDLKQSEETINTNRQRLMLEMAREDRMSTSSELSNLSTLIDVMGKVPEGEQFEFNGQLYEGMLIPPEKKDFFTGSNIISLMKGLKQGESTSITDPNTGRVFDVSGTDQPDRYTATDDRGDLSIVQINPTTGQSEVIGELQGVGKTKTQAANVSLTLAGQEKGAKQSIADNLNAARNPDTNTVTPDAYVSQYVTFLTEGLGDIGGFRASFPASLYLSPEDAKQVNEELAAAEAGLSSLKAGDEEDDDEPLF